MSRIALWVEIRAQPGCEQALRERLGRHAAHCLAAEPGCERFDVLRDPAHPEKVFLYEVYADANALAAHDASEHMQAWRADAAALVAERRRRQLALAD